MDFDIKHKFYYKRSIKKQPRGVFCPKMNIRQYLKKINRKPEINTKIDFVLVCTCDFSIIPDGIRLPFDIKKQHILELCAI